MARSKFLFAFVSILFVVCLVLTPQRAFCETPLNETEADVLFGSIVPPRWATYRPEIVKRLKLTDEQLEKLRAITSEAKKDGEEFRKKFQADHPKALPNDLTLAEILRGQDVDEAIRKKVEAVLTPEQNQTIDDLKLRIYAFEEARNEWAPRKDLEITEEQKKKLRDVKSGYHQNPAESAAKVLTKEQMERLRKEAFGPVSPPPLDFSFVGRSMTTVRLPFAYYDFSGSFFFMNSDFDESQKEQVKKLLGGNLDFVQRDYKNRLTKEWETYSEEQKESQKKIVGKELKNDDENTKADKATAEWRQLDTTERAKRRAVIRSQRERERREWREELEKQPIIQFQCDLEKKFRAILTPKQLAEYEERIWRDIEKNTLVDEPLLAYVGASDEQIDSIENAFLEEIIEEAVTRLNVGEKVVQILKKEQSAKLLAEILQTNGAYSLKEQTNSSGDYSSLSLPGYDVLQRKSMQDYLKLSDAEVIQLMNLQNRWSNVDSPKIIAIVKPLPDSQYFEEGCRLMQIAVRDVRRRVAKILKPEQFDSLNAQQFGKDVSLMLLSKETVSKLDLSEEQHNRIREIEGMVEIYQKRQEAECGNKMLAVFQPLQKENVLKALRDSSQYRSYMSRKVSLGDGVGDVEIPMPVERPDLSNWQVQATLKLSKDQLKEIQKLLGGHEDILDALNADLRSLPLDEQKKQRDVGDDEERAKRPLDRKLTEYCDRLETVLTPEQKKTYEGLLFVKGFRWLRNAEDLKLSDSQESALKEISHNVESIKQDIDRDKCESIMATLTTEQKKILYDQIDVPMMIAR